MSAISSPQSPLLLQHRALGASFTDFAGWQMPLKYTSELDEHRAVRTTAGLFDLSHMGEIDVIGADAAALLDFALAGTLSGIGVGRAKYSLLCDAQGGVIDDLVVYRRAERHFTIVANAANAKTVFGEVHSRAAPFESQVVDRSAETALIAVQGPAAQDIVVALGPDAQSRAVEALGYYGVMDAEIGGLQVLLARTGYTGEDGFELYVSNGEAVQLWDELWEATTSRGGVAAGLACRDTLRLEAGMALYGHELTLHTNPYEARLGRVVDLTKNFVGRDALNKMAESAPQRRLVGLAGTGRRAARDGYTVHGAGGGVVGTVTSGALSPTLGYPIALAYVGVESSELGSELSVDIRGRLERFTVTKFPFYRRP